MYLKFYFHGKPFDKTLLHAVLPLQSVSEKGLGKQVTVTALWAVFQNLLSNLALNFSRQSIIFYGT